MLCIRPFILNTTFLLSSEYFIQMHFFLTVHVRHSFPRLRDRKKMMKILKTKKGMFFNFLNTNRCLNFERQNKLHHTPSINHIIMFIITINYRFNVEHQRSQSSRGYRWQNLKTLKNINMNFLLGTKMLYFD